MGAQDNLTECAFPYLPRATELVEAASAAANMICALVLAGIRMIGLRGRHGLLFPFYRRRGGHRVWRRTKSKTEPIIRISFTFCTEWLIELKT